MRRSLYWKVFAFIIIGLVVMPAGAEAGKPQKEIDGQMVYVGNGYPSGPHYNLNFIGKWLSGGSERFNCPGEGDYETNTPNKNVIFVPRDPHMDIGVIVESGKRGPKDSVDTQAFEVTDWCTKDFDGTDAALRLPMDPLGYLVYARITGKPVNDNGEGFYADLGGCLKYAEDQALENSNLILLGLVTSTGSYVPTCDASNSTGDTIQLERTNDSPGKGVKKAIPITPIFEWSGTICNIDPSGLDVFCCVDTDDPADGIFEHCDSLSELGGGSCLDYTPPSEINGVTGSWTYSPITASCTIYDDPTWVFNIADFVGYMWDIDSSGAYNIKVRFYPCSELPAGACGEIGM